MRQALPCLAALALLAVAGYRAASDGKPEPPPEPPPPAIDHKALEPVLYDNLKAVINRGVQLYNGGQIDACYRLFEGSLRTVRPLLAHKPALVKEIDKTLETVESNPIIWQRAFALRAVLDKVRKETKPGGPPPAEKKKDDTPMKKDVPPPDPDPKKGDTLKMPRELPEEPSPVRADGELRMPRELEKGKG